GNQPMLASMLHGRSLFELAAVHYLDEVPLSSRDVDYARYDRFAARIVSGIQPVALGAVHALVGLEEVEALPSFVGTGLLSGAGAVFTSRYRLALLQGKWSKLVGEQVLDTYLAPAAPSVAVLAAEIRARWPELLGVIPWDEESILLGATLGEALNLGWNSRKV